MANAPFIRWMIRRDLPEVLVIERACFGDAALTEGDFLAAMRQHDIIGMVCENEEEILGYMLYQLQEGAIEVLHLAVCPRRRRQGIGRRMIDRLRETWSERRPRLTLRVDERSLPCQLWLRSLGFRCVGVERGGSGDHDAYAFEWERTAVPACDELGVGD